MLSTKYMGFSYPAHFLKSRGSVIRNSLFLDTELNKTTSLHGDMLFYTLFSTNKAKYILYRHISCSCSDTIYGKSIKKVDKKSHF